jgi:hypothetical protein
MEILNDVPSIVISEWYRKGLRDIRTKLIIDSVNITRLII